MENARETVISMYSIDLFNKNPKVSNVTYAEVDNNTPGHEDLFNAIDAEISKRRLHFTTLYAIVVTFNNVQIYQEAYRDRLHSFQAVFASDGVDTFGIFNYDKTPRMRLAGSDYLARTGFFEPDNPCVNKRNMFVQGTLSFRLSELSNVGVTGRYVFPFTRCRK